VSYDHSDYEGATFVHDFNQPIPAEHHGCYTLAYDGGSIEHIFNTKEVIENMNAMLRVGGSLIVHSQCNGAAAHGFYQLSPEFFYSVLSSHNGFDDTHVFLVDVSRDTWHLVVPPVIGGRHSIPNRRFDILCVAKKIATVEHVKAQQSDYEIAWGSRERPKRRKQRKWRYFFYPKEHRRFLEQSIKITPETATLDEISAR
jgi:hypothetical protein